jgi:hypothetical protein
MLNTVWSELTGAFSWKVGALTTALLVLPSLYGMSASDGYALSGPADLFALILGGALPLVFPLLAAAVYAVPFSNQLSNRFLLYTRPRIDIRRNLAAKALANLVLAFGVFFLVAFVPFLWAFFIEPSLGLAGPYRLTTAGLTPSELEAYPSTVHTFSQLLAVGPWAYGVGYSLVLGLNGAIYASLGFLLLFLVPNRFVAIAIPFVGYNILNFGFAVLGIPQFSPAMAFPFNLIQFPLWVPFVPFMVLTVITVALAAYIHRSTHRLDVLL